jgi:hypothetical protein
MKKPRAEYQFDTLYGSDHPNVAVDYPVLLECELPYPGVPIPGLLIADKYSFDVNPAMIDSATRLTAAITKWRMKYHNSVLTKVHHARTTQQYQIVHYVQLMPSKWYNNEPCPPQEYAELKAFIRSLPAYRRLPA